ncbi:DUF5675 family protein [Desulfovibrio oxyclinae]|uniref:DUF5675 family protein n=1 Tax=Desulfovibrio oxyclinae TaxID=63560 RepID=UPI0003807E12|nr:DUF5675 family protein [Desulfovibrio oxyclinae]
MIHCVILRDIHTGEATLGRLRFEGDTEDFCFTLEEPWKDNRTYISCIPAGRYRCRRRWSSRFGRELFEVSDVPGRTAILIHAGNTTDDIEGCVLLGESRDVGNRYFGKPAVLESRSAMTRFMERLHGVNAFDLTVEEV